jgi:hypothetical protein
MQLVEELPRKYRQSMEEKTEELQKPLTAANEI